MDSFYAELEPFRKFDDFVDVDAYTRLPDDWLVLCADVRGSTKAIEAGRYKDVNLIGAACITAILNISGDTEVPFVFGGDGATIIIPPSLRHAAEHQLVALAEMAHSKFQLDLRVGVIPVQDLRNRDVDVTVRKYQLSAGNFLAMFSGGGIELADTLLKSENDNNEYLLKTDSLAGPPSLDGLSCRWEPLKPKGGVMLTLMVKAMSSNGLEERRLMGEVLGTFVKNPRG